MPSEQPVTGYVPRGNYGERRRVYHTDPDCHHLERVERPREATQAELEELDLCQTCSDEGQDAGARGGSHYRSLVAAAQNNADETGGSA